MRNEQLNTDISRCKRMRAEHFSCVWNGWLAMRLTSIFTNDSTRSPRHTHWIFHGTSAAFYTLSATGGLTQIAFFSGFFSATPQPLHAQPRVLKISWFFFLTQKGLEKWLCYSHCIVNNGTLICITNCGRFVFAYILLIIRTKNREKKMFWFTHGLL